MPSWIFFFVVAAAPLPFGSRDQTTVALWVFLLGLTACFVPTRHLCKRQLIALSGLIAVAAGYGLVLHEQLSAHPWFASPDPIWAKASSALKIALVPSASIARYEPFYNMGSVIAVMFSLGLGLIFGADPRTARKLLFVVGWVGAINAIYGIVAAELDPTMILWRERPQYIGNVTGTFINRNTAAAYFGCIAVIWMLILAERVRRRLSPGPFRWADFSKQILSKVRAELIVPFLLLVVSIAALFRTSSRAGIMLSLTALVGAFFIYFRRHLPKGVGGYVFAAIAILFLLVFLQIFGGSVTLRFDVDGLSDQGRFETYRSTLAIIADHPWFGTGLGTFAWAYPLYRGSAQSMFGTWDMAHSTPLQLASEVGIPLAVLVAIGWSAMLLIVGRAVFVRKRDATIPLAALAIAFIALVHSTIDFTLQVPGFAIVACAIIGSGVGQSLRPRQEQGRGTEAVTADAVASGSLEEPSPLNLSRSRRRSRPIGD